MSGDLSVGATGDSVAPASQWSRLVGRPCRPTIHGAGASHERRVRGTCVPFSSDLPQTSDASALCSSPCQHVDSAPRACDRGLVDWADPATSPRERRCVGLIVLKRITSGGQRLSGVDSERSFACLATRRQTARTPDRFTHTGRHREQPPTRPSSLRTKPSGLPRSPEMHCARTVPRPPRTRAAAPPLHPCS